MSLKKFLKPDKRKILIFLVIIIVSLITGFLGACFGGHGPCYIFPWSYISLVFFSIGTIFTHIGDLFWNEQENIVFIYIFSYMGIILNILYWYILSCLIVWIYDKVKKK